MKYKIFKHDIKGNSWDWNGEEIIKTAEQKLVDFVNKNNIKLWYQQKKTKMEFRYSWEYQM